MGKVKQGSEDKVGDPSALTKLTQKFLKPNLTTPFFVICKITHPSFSVHDTEEENVQRQ